MIPGLVSIFLILLLSLVAHVPPVKQYVLEYGRDYLRESEKIDLQVASLDYNLFNLSATLQGVQLRSAADESLPPLLTADRIYLNLRLTDLVRGRFTVEESRFEGVTLQVVVDQQGRSNLPQTGETDRAAESGEEGPTLLFEALDASGPRFAFEDRSQQIQVDIPQWRFRVRGKRSTEEHAVVFRSGGPGRLAVGEEELPLRQLRLDLGVAPDALQFNTAQIALGGSELSVRGSLTDLSRPVFDLGVSGQLDIGPLVSLAGIQTDAEGRVRLRGKVENSLDDLQLTADLRGQDLSVGELRGVRLNAKPVWNRGAQRLSLRDVSVRSSAGTVRGRADLALDSQAGESTFQARFENLDLALFLRQLKSEYQVASRATGEAQLRWEGLDVSQPTGEARVRLVSSRDLPGKGVLPMAGLFTLTMDGPRLMLATDSLLTMGARINGKVALASQSDLSGEARAELDSVSQTVSALDAFLGLPVGESIVETELEGTASLMASLGGTLENPSFSIRALGEHLRVGEVRDVELRADATYDRSRLDLSRIELGWQEQTLAASGHVRFDEETPSVDLRVQAQDASLGAVLAGFGQAVPIDGAVNLSAEVRGTLEDLSAELAASGSDLTAYGETLGRLVVEGRLATNQQIELSRFQLQKPRARGEDGHLDVTGTYGLRSGEYSLQAKGEDLEFTNLTLPGQVPLRGTLGFAVEGDSVLGNPSLSVAAEASEVVVGKHPLGSIQVSGGLKGNQGELQIAAPLLNANGWARLRTQAPYPVEFEVSVQQADLSRLALTVAEGKPLQGSVSGDIRGAGNWEEWKRGSVAARITDLDIAVAEQQIRIDGPLEARWEDGVFHAEPARLVSGGTELSFAGSLPVDASAPAGELTFQAKVDPESLLALLPPSREWLVSGDIQVDGALRGSLASLEPSGRLVVRGGFFFDPATFVPFTDVAVSAQIRDGSLVLESATAEWASGNIAAEGELPLGMLATVGLPVPASQSERPARLRVRTEGLKPEATGALPENVGGTLSFRVEAEAPELQLAAVSAQSQFDELLLKVAEFEMRQSSPVTISFRDGVASVDQFELRGPETRLQVAGRASWEEPQALDLKVSGQTDAGILAFGVPSFQASGETQIQLAIGGTPDDPQLSGSVELKDGLASLEDPPLQGERLNASLRITPDRLTVENVSGNLNGGDLQASGALGYSGTTIENVQFGVTARNLFLDFPPGLKTASEADIKIDSQGDQTIVGGELRILEGSYRDPLELESEILSFLESGRTLELAEERSPFLSGIRYNVAIKSLEPIVVDNNLARLSATSNLRLTGTYYRPSLVGRLSLEEGGELYLSEKTYVIDTGRVDFVSENRIEPSVNIVARTRAGGYDIELRMIGDTKDLETTLTSDPPLPEPDILSLLITGRTLDEARSAGVNVAKEQALSYITGRVGGRLSRQAQEKLGLSQVRIEPNLIASESDPTVRLTVGQDLRRDLRLIYSMNLADSGDQIYVTEYDLTKRFNTSAVKQSDNSYRLGFRHDLQFGGSSLIPTQRTRQERRIGEITIEGNPVLPEEQLLEKLGVKTGKTYDFFKLQKGMDRLTRLYRKQNYAESRVRLQQQKSPSAVDLELNVEAGPVVEFAFHGPQVPDEVRRQVRQDWQRGVFDAQRAQDAVQTIRRWLVRSDYLQPKVTYDVEAPSSSVKRVNFRIEPGVGYEDVKLVFEGASGLSPAELETLLRDQNALSAVYVDPQRVVDVLTEFYQRRGYLDAVVQRPRYELQPATRSGRVTVPVQEGPLYRYGKLVFQGNQAVGTEQLLAAILLEPQRPYDPETLERAVTEIEELYWSRGYNDVVANLTSNRKPASGELDLIFAITENQQDVIETVTVEGNDAVSESFIRDRIKLTEAGILDFEKADRSRKALYRTGAFSLVDFETEPLGEATRAPANGQKRLRLRTKVREVRPFKLRYGGFFDTDRGPGAILDFENRNSLGGARTAGVRTRYDSELREVRGYFGQPISWGIPGTLNVAGFRRREILQRDLTSDFITDRTGFSLQQELEFKDEAILTYGYRFERAHTFDREADPNCPLPPDDPLCRFDETLNIAPLTASLSWDTRDNLLDATGGLFSSHAIEWAVANLASDLRFVKYFGQVFKYIPLTEPSEVPLSGGVKKPRFIYAGGARVGLGKGFGGQGLILSERFFAGGGTTIRGFEQNTLGPTDFLGDPAGGEAVFIVNNELRFPVASIFEGVGFVDVGNVYPTVSEFDPFDVRKSAGAGLRVRTPYFLLRLDYGFKLDRKPDERRGSFFFSIGQAF